MENQKKSRGARHRVACIAATWGPSTHGRLARRTLGTHSKAVNWDSADMRPKTLRWAREVRRHCGLQCGSATSLAHPRPGGGRRRAPKDTAS